MYKCKECGKVFEEPITVNTTYESYYGVSGLFPDHNTFTYYTCPCCNSEDLYLVHENELEREAITNEIKKLDGYNKDYYDIEDAINDYCIGSITWEEAIDSAKDTIKYYDNMHLE